MRESEVEKYLKKKVKNELKGLALKFVSPGFNGVPDRIILVPMGRIYFVETKAPGKTVRKLQSWVGAKFSDLGFNVSVIDTKAKVDEFVAEVIECGI